MAKLKPTATAVLTGNDLLTGSIVYWDGSGWTGDIAKAARATGEDAHTALEAIGSAQKDANVVVDVYLFALDARSGTPIELRERQRLLGPSIALPQNVSL